nr:uncharacterized protein LOC123747193 [Procambarus clarkii]
MGTSEADPAAAATAALPPSTDRRPRARARGHTSRQRASSSSPSSFDESPEKRAPPTFSSPWPGQLRATTGSSIPLLGVHIPQALQEKVWANKYVDLGHLLAYERESGSFESHSATFPDAKQPGKKQPSLTPDQWAHGLDIYATIYVEKHPAEAQALFTYARYVKTMKTTLKGDWMWYDKAFRWDRERSGCSWLDYRLDLEFRSVQRIAQAAAQPMRQEAGRPAALSLSSARAAGLPPGYCFAYHSRGPGCTFTSCSFKHYCPRCRRRTAQDSSTTQGRQPGSGRFELPRSRPALELITPSTPQASLGFVPCSRFRLNLYDTLLHCHQKDNCNRTCAK